VDIRDVNGQGYQQAQQAVDAATSDTAWPALLAFLVGSPAQFGFGRQLMQLAPDHVTVEIFSSETDALAWLDV